MPIWELYLLQFSFVWLKFDVVLFGPNLRDLTPKDAVVRLRREIEREK
jgi:hypothetical protein